MKYSARNNNKYSSEHGVLELFISGAWSGTKQAMKVLFKDLRRMYIKNTMMKLKNLKKEYPEAEEVDAVLEKLYFLLEYV